MSEKTRPPWPLSVGNDELDSQHRGFFALVAEIQHFYNGTGRVASLEVLIDQIRLHSLDHFAAEEAIMAAHQYPGLEEHQKAHGEFIDQLEKIRQRHDSSREATLDLLFFVREWLIGHLKQADADYAPYLRASPPA